VPKIISERSEFVMFYHINRSGPVFLDTVYINITNYNWANISSLLLLHCFRKVKYVDLYSASTRSASNALTLPVSRR